MMNTEESNLFAAVCAGRDKLSERFDAMQFSRDLWRGGCIVLLILAVLEILRQWAGWAI